MKPSQTLADAAPLKGNDDATAAAAPAPSARLQRPLPQRQAPLRRPPLGLPAHLGAALNGSLGASLDSTADAGLQGTVERGVRSAYTVIDAYLQRGQQAAQRLSGANPLGSAGPGGLGGTGGLGAAGGLGSLAGLGAALGGAAPWGQQATALAGPWLQLARAWADALSTLAPLAARMGSALGDGVLPQGFAATAATTAAAANPAASATDCAAAAPAPAANRGPHARLTLELLSRRIGAVTVSLDPGADLADLQVDWQSGGAAAPASARLYCEPGHVHVRLRLADPAQPGHHEARLIDLDGQAWGLLAMTVTASAGPASA